MQRVLPLVVLLAGVGSGQILFSMRSLAEPRLLFGRLLGADPAPAEPQAGSLPAALDYKQQVEMRNQECYQSCAKEFPNAEGSAKVCERGCRLYGIQEATEPKLEPKQHREKCNKVCETTYPILVEQHSCQSGCHLQKPKEEDAEGAPVVMSVVRKFSFDSSAGQEIRRSQSSVVVRDQNGVQVINGPTVVVAKQHVAESPAAAGPEVARARSGLLTFTDGAAGGGSDDVGPRRHLEDMMTRMRDAMHRMMQHLTGEMPQRPPPAVVAEPRHDADAQRTIELVDVQPAAANSGWRRVWRCSPHHALLAALLLGTAIILYAVYCVICVVVRSRRRRDALIQNMEVAEAEDLPPKYCVVDDVPVKVLPEGVVPVPAPEDVPPAYSAVVAESPLPPKPQI